MPSGYGQLSNRIEDENVRKELERINKQSRTTTETTTATPAEDSPKAKDKDLKVSVENKIIPPGKDVRHIDHESLNDWIELAGKNKGKSNGGNKVQIQYRFNEEKLCKLISRLEGMAQIALSQRSSSSNESATSYTHPYGAFHFDKPVGTAGGGTGSLGWNSNELTAAADYVLNTDKQWRILYFDNDSFTSTCGTKLTEAPGAPTGAFVPPVPALAGPSTFVCTKPGFYRITGHFSAATHQYSTINAANYQSTGYASWDDASVQLGLHLNGGFYSNLAAGLAQTQIDSAGDVAISIDLHGDILIYLEEDDQLQLTLQVLQNTGRSGTSFTERNLHLPSLALPPSQLNAYFSGQLIHTSTMTNAHHTTDIWND